MTKINVYLMENVYIPNLKARLDHRSFDGLRADIADYKNTVNPKEISEFIITSIDKYIDKNQFSRSEVKTILTEFMPSVDGIGGSIALSIYKRWDLIKHFDLENENKETRKEFDITLKALENIRNTVKKHLHTKYINPPQSQNNKLSLKQIALLYIYQQLPAITRENGDEIAQKYGYSSGEKLYHYYTYYYSNQNRRGDPDTLQKLKNKIKLIESVIPLLPKDKQAQPKDEINILKKIQDKTY